MCADSRLNLDPAESRAHERLMTLDRIPKLSMAETYGGHRLHLTLQGPQYNLVSNHVNKLSPNRSACLARHPTSSLWQRWVLSTMILSATG